MNLKDKNLLHFTAEAESVMGGRAVGSHLSKIFILQFASFFILFASLQIFQF